MISRVRRLIVAAAALAAAATVVVPAPPAIAAAPSHVGIVVRFADGNVSTACATVGGNGYTVLSRKFQIHVGTSGTYAGFLLQISQLPNPANPDTTHYWSYWHPKSGGGWTYSSSGAGSYTPKAGGIEGWSYVNGQSAAPPPPNYTYAALCASSDVSSKPTATPTPRPKSSTKSASSPTARSQLTRSPSAARTLPAVTKTPQASAAPKRTASATSGNIAETPGNTVSPVPVSPSSRLTFGASPVSFTAAAAPATLPKASAHSASSGFPAWGTVVALLVVVALGGGAWFATTRRTD